MSTQGGLRSLCELETVTCRLLYLVGQLGFGGSERQLFYLLQHMDRKRYRPAVAVWNFCETECYVNLIRELGIPLYSIPDGVASASKLHSFRRLVLKIRPEVVHSYSFYLNFAAYWAAQGTQAVALGSSRSNFLLEWKETSWWLARLSARWPRSQIYNSAGAAEIMRRHQNVFAPDQVFVIRNAVDLDYFRPLTLPNQNHPQILGIGSLLPVKRWDRLLAVAAELKRRGLNFSIRIAGDGPLRQQLQVYAQDAGIQDRVQLPGYSANVASLLSEATFLVHPSESEGCPNVVMEAMACGRAVIGSDVGDIPSLVEDGQTGFVVRCGDDGMLVDRMVKLIKDEDLCRRMGDAGRVKAEREFGLDRLISETLAAYRVAGWRNS